MTEQDFLLAAIFSTAFSFLLGRHSRKSDLTDLENKLLKQKEIEAQKLEAQAKVSRVSLEILKDNHSNSMAEQALEYQKSIERIKQQEQQRYDNMCADFQKQQHLEQKQISSTATLMELCDAPSGAFIDENGYPHIVTPTGADLTIVNLVGLGKVFHSAHSACADRYYQTHIFHGVKLSPCPKCKPIVPNMSWFCRCIDLVLLFDDCKIPIPHIATNATEHVSATFVLPCANSHEDLSFVPVKRLIKARRILSEAVLSQSNMAKVPSNNL